MGPWKKVFVACIFGLSAVCLENTTSTIMPSLQIENSSANLHAYFSTKSRFQENRSLARFLTPCHVLPLVHLTKSFGHFYAWFEEGRKDCIKRAHDSGRHRVDAVEFMDNFDYDKGLCLINLGSSKMEQHCIWSDVLNSCTFYWQAGLAYQC